jgi:hypothetical protein
MSTTPPPIDISTIPDLIRIVEELKTTKQPRIIKQDSEPVALLMPVGHNAVEVFDFQPLDTIKQSFIQAGYTDVEVNDMLEALSELPHYADQGIRESK